MSSKNSEKENKSLKKELRPKLQLFSQNNVSSSSFDDSQQEETSTSLDLEVFDIINKVQMMEPAMMLDDNYSVVQTEDDEDEDNNQLIIFIIITLMIIYLKSYFS